MGRNVGSTLKIRDGQIFSVTWLELYKNSGYNSNNSGYIYIYAYMMGYIYIISISG